MIPPIPRQLQNKFFRFILLGNKQPIEKGWQKIAHYSYWHPKIVMHRREGRNIGIATGYGNLLVVDFDSAEAQQEVEPKLPPTFTVKTGGKGLHHLYFFCDVCESWKVLAADKSTIADIQGAGKQVVAPGSKNHTTGRFYEVVSDVQIARTTAEEIRNAFSKYAFEHNAHTVRPANNESEKSISQLTQQVVAAGVTIPKILQKLNISTAKNPTDCPFHSSVGGKCFSYTEAIWHCFHCEKGGNIADLLLEVQYA